MIVRCQNSGQTPATFFEIGFASRVVAKEEKWAIPQEMEYLTWNALGGSNQVTLGLYSEKFADTARTVMQSEGRGNFFLLGRVRYGDTWGNEYETEFAYFTNNATPNRPDMAPFRKMSRAPGNLRTFRMTKKAADQENGASQKRWFQSFLPPALRRQNTPKTG
jgi:hypothetical protein